MGRAPSGAAPLSSLPVGQRAATAITATATPNARRARRVGRSGWMSVEIREAPDAPEHGFDPRWADHSDAGIPHRAPRFRQDSSSGPMGATSGPRCSSEPLHEAERVEVCRRVARRQRHGTDNSRWNASACGTDGTRVVRRCSVATRPAKVMSRRPRCRRQVNHADGCRPHGLAQILSTSPRPGTVTVEHTTSSETATSSPALTLQATIDPRRSADRCVIPSGRLRWGSSKYWRGSRRDDVEHWADATKGAARQPYVT